MDFPIFTQLEYNADDLNDFSSFLSSRLDFNVPVYMDVNGLDKQKISGLIALLKEFYQSHGKCFKSPYPFYLVGDIIKKQNFDWTNFVASVDDLPCYFRRKIFMKNTKQIKEMKNFLVYQIGLDEQRIGLISERLGDLNNTCLELKKEKIQNYKLNKIIESFK